MAEWYFGWCIVIKRTVSCMARTMSWFHREHVTQNLSHWVFSNYILTQNLTMFPTSDQRIKTIFSIAHNLSYNILKFGRKLLNNNRDTGQRTLSCRFMFWKKSPAIDITRKYMKNYALSPLIENLTMMTSQNWQINVIYLVENCLSYNISKFGRKPITDKWDNLSWTKDVWRHQWKFWRARTCASWRPRERGLLVF